MKLTLGTDSAARKDIPVFSGVLKYAPAAIAGVAKVSMAGNKKHNPGEPLHHARGKSTDHADCIVRHAMDVADLEAYILRNDVVQRRAEQDILNEVSQLAWRALMWSQELHERWGGAPLAPGARLPADRGEFVMHIQSCPAAAQMGPCNCPPVALPSNCAQGKESI